MKKLAAILAAALMCAVCCVTASAEEWSGDDFKVTLPEEFTHIFTPSMSSDDPEWVLAGVADPTSKLEEYSDMSIIAEFRTDDGTSLSVQKKSNSTTESIYNLSTMTDEELTEFCESIVQSNSEDITVTNEIETINGQPFCVVQIDGTTDDGEAHEIFYMTVINGHTLAFDIPGGDSAITDEQHELLKAVVNSIEFTQILDKPEAEPMSAVLIIVLLAAIVVIVVAPFIYVPIRNKKDKKEKAQMAERLSAYRAKFDENTSLGEAKFVNATDCTKEAIRTFSVYHSYVKGFVSLALGCAMCIVALVVVFLFDMTWWMKLAAVAVSVYFAYKAVNMPNAVEKVQRKVFGRGVSSTARYTFFEDGFKVAGIQSSSLYPYFQITSIRDHGNYLYLYYDLDNAYLIDKFGFTVGELEDFEKFIKEKTSQQEGK